MKIKKKLIKFFGIFVSQMTGRLLHIPVLMQASRPPNNDMTITIGMTIQQDTESTFLIVLLSGPTKKRNANFFAGVDTINQSNIIA